MSPIEENHLVCAGATDTGRLRTNNEDSFYLDSARGILMVIDGMGGRAAGEIAAEIALRAVRRRLERRTGSVKERIREAITLANNEIYREAVSRPERAGMACVLTVAVIEGGVVTVGHVGDTRLYQLRDGRIEKITRDHSPVGILEDRGELTEIEAMRHPGRNEVSRGVGVAERAPDDDDFIEIFERSLTPGAALLLCSDGLSDSITSAQMLSIIEQYAGRPEEIVERLIAAANAAGGKDNITTIYAANRRSGSGDSARRGSRIRKIVWPLVTAAPIVAHKGT